MIDDKLPVSKTDNKTVNLDKDSNDAWYPALLEKAFAKYFGNYAKINGGDITESLRVLTGGAIVKLDLTKMSEDEVFDAISGNGNNTHPMIAAASADHEGLKKGQMYYVIAAFTVTPNPKKPKKIEKII